MTSLSDLQQAADKNLAETTALQNAAADPDASVWVSANAGTGKTHVLTNRVLRLLLTGTPPEKILCLTYTKAAAAEMSSRVFDRLADWVTAGDADLSQALNKLLARAATGDETLLARQLFTRAIETPGGLKVQTIHAFCERLLQRFPLEAGVPPAFAILDDTLQMRLKRESINDVLDRAARKPKTPLGAALQIAIAYAQEDRFDDMISAALQQRAFLEGVMRLPMPEHADATESDPAEGALNALDRLLRQTFSLSQTDTTDDLKAQQANVMTKADATRVLPALDAGKKTDTDTAARLARAVAVWDDAIGRVTALSDVFLTKSGGARARLTTKDVLAAAPDACGALEDARDAFANLEDRIKAVRTVEATLALVRLADAVMQTYTDAKARRAVLDYDDLIIKTGNLLATSGEAAWVLYKLDGGLDHILVDESQDTSRPQWDIIEGLAREFFSGEGAREEARTVFAVGDEKQSIYSFQGAAPDMFAEKGADFKQTALAAGRVWRNVPLTLSFRTVAAVLEAVDKTFADATVTPGLTSDSAATIAHLVKRVGQGGVVEIWPTETLDDGEDVGAFELFSDTTRVDPAVRLADTIADTIEGWLKRGDVLASCDRPVRPSDILILVRKRTQFANPMVAALKARGIPVAGSDRMDLTGQLVVRDLMALGDFLVLPEDDLALACVLKSPLFGFDDDDLFDVSHRRKGSLWRALLAHRGVSDRYGAAVDQLIAWRKRADFLPPFEFFSDLLDRDGGRGKLLGRLGMEAADPLDEFLNAAIQFDDGEPPSLQGFMTWLRSGARQVKRDMEQGANEVRVLTVHGAKGLEAPIVFLPDTCSTQGAGGAGGSLVNVAPYSGAEADVSAVTGFDDGLAVWAVAGAGSLAPIKQAKATQAALDTEERNRLLYVAMTRARDRLYVCGFETKRGRQKGCWYDLIDDALADLTKTVRLDDGRDVKRFVSPQALDADGAGDDVADDGQARQALPPWATRPAPTVIAPSVPIAPSRLAPYDYDEDGEPTPLRPTAASDAARIDEPTAASPVMDGSAATEGDGGPRFLRGTLTHALLQYLPDVNASKRLAAAQSYVADAGVEISAAARASIVSETLAILDHADFAHLFGPGSRAEASISAAIPYPDGTRPPLRISGQVDRLAILPDRVAIVDFKSNRTVPGSADRITEAYVLQLAAYRLTLQAIYPDLPVEAYLLWTAGPYLVRIPDDVLNARTSTLWDVRSPNLDGP